MGGKKENDEKGREGKFVVKEIWLHIQTRPDTRLPQSRADGQGLYFRSLDHLGRSSEAKTAKTPKK